MERYGPGEQQNLVFKNFRPKRSPENTLKNTLKTPIFFFQNMSCGASMERYGPGEQLRMVFNDLRVVQPRVVPCAICTWVPSSPLYILRLNFPSFRHAEFYFEGVPK